MATLAFLHQTECRIFTPPLSSNSFLPVFSRDGLWFV